LEIVETLFSFKRKFGEVVDDALIALIFPLCPQQSGAKCLAGLLWRNSWPTCPAAKGVTPSPDSILRSSFALFVSFAQKPTQAC